MALPTLLLAWAVLGTVVLAVVVAMDARNRGLSPTLWGGLTVVLSVFGALAYIVARPVERFEEVVVDASEEGEPLEHAVQSAPRGSLWARAHPQPPQEPIAVGSSRVDLQACKLEYSIVSPK